MTSQSERLAPQSRSGFPIFGQIREADGTPMVGATLTMIDLGGRQLGRGRTGEDGYYELTAPSSGSVVLIASARAYQPQASTASVLDGPVRLDIVLRGASKLFGVVRVAGSGAVLPGAALTLTDLCGEVVDAQISSAAGEFAFSTMTAGEYTLAVNAELYQPTARGVSVDAGGDTRLDIELIGSAAIAGTVRSPDGARSLPAAQVTVLDAAGNVVGVTTADEAGRYLVDGLSAGAYTVIATSYPPAAQVLRLDDGQQTRHDIRLG